VLWKLYTVGLCFLLVDVLRILEEFLREGVQDVMNVTVDMSTFLEVPQNVAIVV